MHSISPRVPIFFRALLSRKIKFALSQLRFGAAVGDRAGALPPGDRFARDIGLTPTDQARLELRMPSQTWHHPRL